MQEQRKLKLLHSRVPGFAFVVLLCLSTFLCGCDAGRSAVASSATVTPTLEPLNTGIDSSAERILKKAAFVAGSLKSYHIVFVMDLTKSEIDVVAPDRCRAALDKNGARIDIIRTGQYIYEQQARTQRYVEYKDPFTGNSGCLGDFLPDFREQVSRLTEASIVGYEYQGGQRVVHIRYKHSPPPAPFPTGSGAASVPPAEVWIVEQSGRAVKAMQSVYEPEVYQVYSRFDEPVVPPIERPARFATVTPTR